MRQAAEKAKQQQREQQRALDRLLERQQLAEAAEMVARERAADFERLNGPPPHADQLIQQRSLNCCKELQQAALLLEVGSAFPPPFRGQGYLYLGNWTVCMQHVLL